VTALTAAERQTRWRAKRREAKATAQGELAKARLIELLREAFRLAEALAKP
jgi:hypothetical protein